MSERETTRREPMTAAHLRELADAGSMAMIVVYATEPDARRGTLYTHVVEEYQARGLHGFRVRLYSRRANLTYTVTEEFCECEHWSREVQRVAGALCRHQRFFGARFGDEIEAARERTNGQLARLAALT